MLGQEEGEMHKSGESQQKYRKTSSASFSACAVCHVTSYCTCRQQEVSTLVPVSNGQAFDRS